MTVANNYAPVVTAANSVAVQFSGPWNPISSAYIVVQLLNTTTGIYTPVTQGVGAGQYLVINSGPTGFLIQFNTAPATGNKVVITRNTPLIQEEPYTTSRGFQGPVEEGSFDALTAMVQEISQSFGKSIQASAGDAAANLTLPLIAQRANTYLAFDASGNVISVAGTTSATVSAAMLPVIAAPTTAAALALLGAPSANLIFDIRNYGAVCDGVTDDTTHIQTAVNLAQSFGGGRVIISGYSKITATITITGSGVEVVGLDRINTGVVCSSTAVTAFKIGGVSTATFRCKVANMKIASCNIAVYVGYNTAQNYVDDLYITGGVGAVTVQGDYTTNPIKDAINTSIKRVEAENMTGDIFYFYMCGEVYFDGLQTPGAVTATAYGMVIDSGVTAVYGSHANFTGCKGGLLINDGTGISPNPTSLPTRPRQMYFYQVQGDTCHDFGIQVQRGYQIEFVDCWGSGSTNGPGWAIGDGSNNISQISLLGCRALGNNQDGFRWVTGATDLNSQMIGCHALSNGTNGAGQYDGIAVQPSVSGLVISGCNSFNDTAQGLNNTQRYGLNLVSGAITGVVATGNNFAGGNGNFTGAVNYGTSSSDNQLTSNQGFNDVGFAATATIPASGTAFVNPYGRPMWLSLTGGTTTAIELDGITVGTTTPYSLYVGAGHSVTIVWSVKPSGSWVGL